MWTLSEFLVFLLICVAGGLIFDYNLGVKFFAFMYLNDEDLKPRK